MIRFELHRSSDARQPYYWRVVSTANGRILAHSETYVNRQDAINAANAVKVNAYGADFIDYTAAA